MARTTQAVVTFAVAVCLMFFLMRIMPGDPLAHLSQDRQLSGEQIANLRARYGLDQPLGHQFSTFVSGVLRADLGVSIQYARPVTGLIAERLGASLLLGGSVLFLNFTVGLWLGVWQAVRHGRAADRWLGIVSLTGYAMPSFWLGLVLAWGFAVELRVFPAAGMHDPLLRDTGPLAAALDVARHLVLPVVTLSAVSMAATMRYQRAAMLETLRADFVRTARAKGLPERAVIWRHAWRNALFPVITLFGLWLPILVVGSVFVESVFAWPGLGWLAADAVFARDYPLLMGSALLVSALVVGGGLLADVAYLLLDPRVRHP